MLDIRKRTLYRFYAFLRLLIIPINQLIYIRLCMTTENGYGQIKLKHLCSCQIMLCQEVRCQRFCI